MGFGFKQPLVGEKRCVTTLITAAEETIVQGMSPRICFRGTKYEIYRERVAYLHHIL